MTRGIHWHNIPLWLFLTFLSSPYHLYINTHTHKHGRCNRAPVICAANKPGSGFGSEQRRGQHSHYRSSSSSVLTKSLYLSGSHTNRRTHAHISTHMSESKHKHACTVGIHARTHTLRDLTWTSGHLVEEFNWPLSLSVLLSLSSSLYLSGCRRTCRALNAFQSSPQHTLSPLI